MTSEARRALYTEGRLVGDRSRICEDGFAPAYEWMAGEMGKMLAPPPDGVDAWPLWAWFRHGKGGVDPDADEYADQDLWVMTFETDPRHVVISDFDAWHYVLQGWYLPDRSAPDGGDAEADQFADALNEAGVEWGDHPYPEPFASRIQNSWKRVFDLSGKTRSKAAKTKLQATFWVLDRRQILFEEPCRGTVHEMQLKCA